MIKHNLPGKFIVLEGLDGSGQSTQTLLLKAFLEQQGFSVATAKEPTADSQSGREIKAILSRQKIAAPEKLQELFSQDRREHLENKIIPALKANTWVICDRYFFSSFAFGASDGLDIEWLIKINNDFILPDKTFILKVSPKVCIERINKRGTIKELFETEEKLGRVWHTYEQLPMRFENVVIVNGEQPVEQVSEDVKNTVRLLWKT